MGLNTKKFQVASFYRFFPVERDVVGLRRASVQALGVKLGLTGLCIIATEGLNGTVSGEHDDVEKFISSLNEMFGSGDWCVKYNWSELAPFKDFRVKLKPEIVTARSDYSGQEVGSAPKLSPAEWHERLQSGEDFVLLDTRNDYEIDLGKFKGAVDFRLDNFQEFPEAVKKSGIPKDKPVMMYCTGGIRCEKASLEMMKQGYEKVYQLDGGILRYLEIFPGEEYEGDCFVFDNRVAVNQQLEPVSEWKFCPHCGQPGRTKLACGRCGSDAVLCEKCSPINACSKDCAYHLRRLAANG